MQIQEIIEDLQFLSLEELLVVQVNLDFLITNKKRQQELIKKLKGFKEPERPKYIGTDNDNEEVL